MRILQRIVIAVVAIALVAVIAWIATERMQAPALPPQAEREKPADGEAPVSRQIPEDSVPPVVKHEPAQVNAEPPAEGDTSAETPAESGPPTNPTGKSDEKVRLVTISILGPDGEPLDFERIQVVALKLPRRHQRNPWRVKLRHDELPDAGPCTIPCPAELFDDPAENKSMQVAVVADGYARTLKEYPFPGTEIEFRFEEPAELWVHVENAEGYPDFRVFWHVNGGLLTYRLSPDAPKREHADGSTRYYSPFLCEPLPAGKCRLEIIRAASKRNGFPGWGPLVLQARELDLKPGRNDVTIRYPVLHRVTCTSTVKVAGPLRLVSTEGANVELEPTVPSGETVFNYVPEGDWILADKWGRQRISVLNDLTVSFSPVESDCYFVAGISEDSPFRELGMLPGDRIVAVNGVEWTRLRDAGITRRGRRDSPTTLTVLRDGERFQISYIESELEDKLRGDVERHPPGEDPEPDIDLRPQPRNGWPKELQVD